MTEQIKAMTPGARQFVKGGAPVGGRAILSCRYPLGQHWKKAHSLKAAGITYDPGTVDAEIILEKLYGYAWPIYPLYDNVARETRDVIKFTARYATKFTGSEKVGRLEEPEVKESSYSDKDFTLWKNAAHVAKADEAMLEASHDIMQYDQQNASRDIARMRDSQIKDAIQAATNSSAGTDWGLMSTPPNNDFDPWADWDTALTAIEDTNGWDCDVFYCGRKVWTEFTRNTYVKDVVDIQYVGIGGGDIVKNRVFNLTHKAIGKSIKVVVSSLMGANEGVFADSTAPAFLVGKGPMIAEEYRIPQKAMDGYVIWDYIEPLEIISGAAYEFTTLTA